MSKEQTPLERAAELFERTEWPGRLKYSVLGYYYIPGTQQADSEATDLVVAELWRRILVVGLSARRYGEEIMDGHRYYLEVRWIGANKEHLEQKWRGPDELALLIDALEEIEKC